MEVDKELLRDAVEVFGKREQMDIIGEECTELADVINKFRRGRVDMDKMIDEIADVFIVINYGPVLFDEVAIQERIQFKLNRLRERIAEKRAKNWLLGSIQSSLISKT